MTLASTGRSRERILLFGMEGTGKSLAALDIAARVAPNRVHIIDNDNAWDRMLEGQTLDGRDVAVCAEYRWEVDERGKGSFEFDDRWVTEAGNVVVYHVDGWEANAQAIKEVRLDAEPDDWCVIDSGSALWSDVQDWYVDSVFDKSKADFFLQARLQAQKSADGKGGEALDGWKDWSVINAVYREGVMAFLITPPCHLLVTAEQADVSTVAIGGKSIEDKETRALYSGRMVKPNGQKRMGHNVQTIVQLTRDRDGTFHAFTVKDRGGRERCEGDDVTDRGFSEWYLEEVGGWSESQDSPATTAPTRATSAASTPAKKITPKVVAKS